MINCFLSFPTEPG